MVAVIKSPSCIKYKFKNKVFCLNVWWIKQKVVVILQNKIAVYYYLSEHFFKNNLGFTYQKDGNKNSILIASVRWVGVKHACRDTFARRLF